MTAWSRYTGAAGARRLPRLLRRSSSSAAAGTGGATDGAAPPRPPTTTRTALAATALASVALGFAAGRASASPYDSADHRRVLPSGLPRTCCEEDLTPAQRALPGRLAKLVGPEQVLPGAALTPRTLPFLRGARLGGGPALCIVAPRRLADVAAVVKAVVDAGCVLVVQGQNTGLTGGSVPRGGFGDGAAADPADPQPQPRRPTVVLSMKHLDRIFPIDDGDRVVCLAGAGLAQLQAFLATHFPDREPHSVLGSTFLNPTAAAGVALGSGGTQLRKGPAYTERALYLRIGTNKWRETVVETVNTLGIRGLQDRDHLPPERARQMDAVPYRLDVWSQWMSDGIDRTMKYSLPEDPSSQRPASDATYRDRLCQRDSDHVNRCNADTRGPDCCRSEGKVVILATVHDTFPKPQRSTVLWLGFDSLDTALSFRREVALADPRDLPASMEYLDRDAFDTIDRAGRVMGALIAALGTASPLLRRLWNLKLWCEALPFRGAAEAVDRLLYRANPLLPPLLPREIMEVGHAFDHHVALTVTDYGDGGGDRLLERIRRFATQHGPDKVAIRDGTPHRAALDAFRFVAAPAFRTWCAGNGSQGVSVDYALPNNAGQAPVLADSRAQPLKRMRYSHFGCNVVHEDLAYGPGVDVHEAKHNLKHIVEFECKGKLPAEHGHGTEYVAPPETQERWKKMDPLNVLNPGIGGLPEGHQYKS